MRDLSDLVAKLIKTLKPGKYGLPLRSRRIVLFPKGTALSLRQVLAVKKLAMPGEFGQVGKVKNEFFGINIVEAKRANPRGIDQAKVLQIHDF